jgi:hypothetical protein
MVRRLNTLQRRFRTEHQVYAEHNELLDALSNLIPTDDQSREMVLKVFSLDAVPGWSILLRLSSARDGYLLSLSTTEQVQPNTIVSDENGVIYFGTLPQAQQLPPDSYAPLSQAYPELRPLQAANPTTSQKVMGWARQLAFAGLGGEAPPPSSCPCGGHCETSGTAGCCNVGTEQCPWCCYAFCGSCSLICWSYCGSGCGC